MTIKQFVWRGPTLWEFRSKESFEHCVLENLLGIYVISHNLNLIRYIELGNILSLTLEPEQSEVME